MSFSVMLRTIAVVTEQRGLTPRDLHVRAIHELHEESTGVPDPSTPAPDTS